MLKKPFEWKVLQKMVWIDSELSHNLLKCNEIRIKSVTMGSKILNDIQNDLKLLITSLTGFEVSTVRLCLLIAKVAVPIIL